MKRNARLVYFVLSAGITLMNTTIFTTLAVYYVVTVGMNPLQLVLVGTVLETAVLLFELPTGIIADSYSRRLSVIIGAFVLGGAYLLEGSLSFFAGVLLAEAIRGVGETFVSGAIDAWIADEVGEAEVGTLYIRAGQIDRIAALVAFGLSAGLASVQLNLPLLAGGVMYLALGLFLVVAMPETGFQPVPRNERTTWQTMGDTLRNSVRVVRGRRVLQVILLISVFVGAASEGFDRLWEAHLLTTVGLPGLGALDPVVWFGIIGVLGTIASLVVVELFRRRLEAVTQQREATARLLLVLEGLSIASILGFALANSFTLALVALLARVAINNIIAPLYNAWTVQNIEPQVRATVLSMRSLTDAFGQTLGGPGVGALGTFGPLRAALVAAGLLRLPVLALYGYAQKRRTT